MNALRGSKAKPLISSSNTRTSSQISGYGGALSSTATSEVEATSYSASSSNRTGSISVEETSLPKLPYGHCAVNPRWKGHAMLAEVGKFFTLHFTDLHDFVDFQPTQMNIVSILTEPELIGCVEDTEQVRKKFAKLYKMANKNPRQCLSLNVIYHLTEVTRPFYFKIQTLCVMDFGMALTPLPSLDLVPRLLERIKVTVRAKNPFKAKRNCGHRNKDLLLVLMCVPGVRENDARKLLQKFGSLSGVAAARQSDVAAVVGDKLARGLTSYLDRRNII